MTHFGLTGGSMVRVGINLGVSPARYPVHCAACGDNIQVTGEGGFADPEEAIALMRSHVMEHIEELTTQLRVEQEVAEGIVLAYEYTTGPEAGTFEYIGPFETEEKARNHVLAYGPVGAFITTKDLTSLTTANGLPERRMTPEKHIEYLSKRI